MKKTMVVVVLAALVFWVGSEWGGHKESQRIYGLSRDERGKEQAQRLACCDLHPWWIVRELHYYTYETSGTGFSQWRTTLERDGGEITLVFGANHPSYSAFEHREIGVNSHVRLYCWETRQDRTAGSDEIARWLLLEKKKSKSSS